MASREEVMALLRDERDDLADQIDGVNFALEAGCSVPALALLLIPGLGIAVYTTARAACASDSADGLRRRVIVAQDVISKLQTMGEAVQAADPSSSSWPAVEKAARDLAAAAHRINLLSDSLFAAAGFVNEVFDAIRRAPNIINDSAWAIGAAAFGIGVLLLATR